MDSILSAVLRRHAARLACCVIAALPGVARADTVASLLGNFTINQFTAVHLEHDTLTVHHSAVFGQLPALRELRAADGDGDGVTSQVERDAYAARLAPEIGARLNVTVDDMPVALRAVRSATSLPTEQGGFSLRLDVDYVGVLPPRALGTNGARRLVVVNQNHVGRFGWNELVLTAGAPWQAFDTDAFSTSLTAGLTEALAALPASGPLNERAINASVVAGPLPAGAVALGARAGTPIAVAASSAAAPVFPDAAWLGAKTRQLVTMVSAPDVSWQVTLLALVAAMVLGALHALSPGHGKTVVGAYLVGSRGTSRHAVFLGLTVTITHTLGVFALGFATLFASRYVVPERLFPVLNFISGLLVLGMGLVLLWQRWPALRTAWHRRHGHAQALAGTLAFRPLAAAHGATGYVAARVRAGHDHAHGHPHVHGAPGMHSHGGRMHSHLPPGAQGEAVSWRSLLAMGVSGGLVPCPSALILLLAAVALNRTAYGLLLVVAFSVGLAMTLIAVGVAFLYARDRLPSGGRLGAWTQVMPAASAAAVTALGALLCYAALVATPV